MNDSTCYAHLAIPDLKHASRASHCAVASRSALLSCVAGAGYCFVTSIIVWLGVSFGADFVKPGGEMEGTLITFFDHFTAWDGQWYASIIDQGYVNSVDEPHSTVVFFPAYPLLSTIVRSLFGLTTTHALILTTHLCLIASFILAHQYVTRRWDDAPPYCSDYVLLAMGLLPITLYFRMAYTESLFLLLIVLTLFGIQQRWMLWRIALVVGCATGTRTVGVALIVPLALHVWDESPNWRAFALRSILLAPLATMGLSLYMGYLWIVFGNPLAFVTAQSGWRMNFMELSPMTQLLRTVALVPLIDTYTEGNSCHWSTASPSETIFFNLYFFHPFYLAFTVATIGFGVWKRWLDKGEAALAALLIVIPYVLQADRMCMGGQSRFCSVVFPMYMVIGRLLSMAPNQLRVFLLSFSAFLLFTYSALFCSWYRYW